MDFNISFAFQSTLIMAEQDQHLRQLSDIKQMMERSSRFISLSGLSGVSAGVAALLGTLAAYLYFDKNLFEPNFLQIVNSRQSYPDFELFFLLDAAAVLVVAFSCAAFFTIRKSKRDGVPLWGATSKRLLVNLLIPLVAGGFFCLMLYIHRDIYLIAPATLLFYGLSLLNASRYTVHDIRYLGISEIILGLLASYFIGYGLLFWTVGFGLLHIIYGGMIYFKYER